jgi:hypothetical protein
MKTVKKKNPSLKKKKTMFRKNLQSFLEVSVILVFGAR